MDLAFAFTILKGETRLRSSKHCGFSDHAEGGGDQYTVRRLSQKYYNIFHRKDSGKHYLLQITVMTR